MQTYTIFESIPIQTVVDSDLLLICSWLPSCPLACLVIIS